MYEPASSIIVFHLDPDLLLIHGSTNIYPEFLKKLVDKPKLGTWYHLPYL
jgi:hypothetical protein